MNAVSRARRAAVLAAGIAVPAAAPAPVHVIDFEGLSGVFVPGGYASFDWLGGFGTASWVLGSSYGAPPILQPVSGVDNAWSIGGTNLVMSRASTFDFGSVWMACAFGACEGPATQKVRGFLLGREIYSSTVTLGTTMAKYVFNFGGVDEVQWDATLPFESNVLIDDIFMVSRSKRCRSRRRSCSSDLGWSDGWLSATAAAPSPPGSAGQGSGCGAGPSGRAPRRMPD